MADGVISDGPAAADPAVVERYRALFDKMDEGFCIIEFLDGPDGPLSDYVHVEANPAYQRHAGISDVVGQRVRAMVPAEADGWVELYGGVLKTGRQIHFERELEATGRYLGISAFRVGDGSERQVAVLFQDITARRQAELALTRANETLEARINAALAERQLLVDLVEGTNSMVQVVDADLRWIAVNRAAADKFEAVFGTRPEIGMRIEDVLGPHPEALDASLARWRRALAGEEFVVTASYGDLDAEARHYELRFNVMRDADGRQIAAYQFVHDVTDRLLEQERLREAEEALRQAQKMEAVGQLTGGLAHDFNNLLAGISGAFEMIGMRLAQGRTADVDRYLTAGLGATKRAAALTHRLLAFSRRQTLSPKPMVVNRLMGELLDLVQRTVGPGIAVDTVAASGLWATLVDANQLENAILNLCINARDAMPDGGRITIETGNKWFDERAAASIGIDPGQYVCVSVSDTGSGIDKDTLDRVFEPFFTTKPLGEGTGLGLSMVYGFAKQSNGHVRIYSEVGQGTMVALYLPRHRGEEAEAVVDAPVIPSRIEAGRTILLIDDEPTVRLLVADALAEEGFVCFEAADGRSGLATLREHPDVDLLITDVGLPGGMNGRQVAEAARAIQPGLKVLFITGYAENAALNHAHIEPGMEVLTKPFTVEDLWRRVGRMLKD